MRLLLVAAMAICLAGPVSAADNRFYNPTAQFELTKPEAWVFVTADQNAANLQAVEVSDAELRQAMAKYAAAPMVVITKHPEPFDDLNPSLKVNARPLGSLAGQSPTTMLAALTPTLQRAFPDAVVVQQPIDTKVAGLPAAYARVNYTLRSGGVAYPTSSELWVVPRGEFVFVIGAGTRQDEATGSRAEIAQILQTIKFGR